MKTLINILSISVYLSLSVGLNVLLHTCGDETSVQAMPLSTDDPCGGGDSHGCCAKDPCCKMELKIFHIYDSQLLSQIPKSNEINLSLIIPATLRVELLAGHIAPVISANTSPPGNIRKFILDCTYLI